MTPREEILATHKLGSAGAELLYKTVWVVAVGRGFPPPAGSRVWDDVAVRETAHDFVQAERGPRRLLDVSLRSVDDRSFERLLEAAVLNHLRDVARRTDFGKLILRVKEILKDENEFRSIPGQPERWTLAAGSAEPSGTSPADMASATFGVEVVVPKWSSERRDPPLADRPSFVRLMVSVLVAAAGSVTATDIAHAITSRLDHRRTALATSLDIRERISEPAQRWADPARQTIAELHAMDIFDNLDDTERIVLPFLDKNVRDLGKLIGCGKSQAALVKQRLIARLQHELADDDYAEESATFLKDLCESWIAHRTGTGDATSID